jgi:hypothetical protein
VGFSNGGDTNDGRNAEKLFIGKIFVENNDGGHRRVVF